MDVIGDAARAFNTDVGSSALTRLSNGNRKTFIVEPKHLRRIVIYEPALISIMYSRDTVDTYYVADTV